MRISILGETLSAAERHPSNAGVAHLKAGDLLQARVVDIMASGKAVFQFEGFRAVAERPLGVQVGDVWQFEVVPDAGAQAEQQLSNRSSAPLMRTPWGTGPPDSLPQGGKFLRLTSLSGKQAAFEPSEATPTTSIRTAPPVAVATATTAASGCPIIQPVQILSTWLQQIRMGARPSKGEQATDADTKPRKVYGLTQEQVPSRLLDRLELTDHKPHDRSGEAWDYLLSSRFQLGRWPVKLKLYRQDSGRGGGGAQSLLAAVFLLNLEHNGAVRVDIKMGDAHLHVGFLVEDEHVRRQFEEALPILVNALASFTTQCYCRVDVDPAMIQDISKAEDMAIEKIQLDIRA